MDNEKIFSDKNKNSVFPERKEYLTQIYSILKNLLSHCENDKDDTAKYVGFMFIDGIFGPSIDVIVPKCVNQIIENEKSREEVFITKEKFKDYVKITERNKFNEIVCTTFSNDPKDF